MIELNNAAVPHAFELEDARYERLEREHFGDIDKSTGIYASKPGGQEGSAKIPSFPAGGAKTGPADGA